MPTQPPRSEDRPAGDRIAKLLARAGVDPMDDGADFAISASGGLFAGPRGVIS